MSMAPIDQLLEILTDETRPKPQRFDGLTRETLSYSLGAGIVKPTFLAERTGVDRAAELAEEIAEEVSKEHERRRQARRTR